MTRLLELIPTQTRFRFMAYAPYGAIASALGIMGIMALLFFKGMNFGIDFSGGILMEIRTQQPANLSELRPLFDRPEYGDTSLQLFGDEREVLIRMEGSEDKEQAHLVEQVKASLIETLGQEVEFRRVDYVGPTVGQEMLESGALALCFAFLGMLIYIWFRFEWQFGMGGMLALLHDTVFIIGFYAICGFEFGLTAIAAILTVIGYSINDSVVIYDRIRENIHKHSGRSIQEIIDLSLNQTLSRTILTGCTTLMAAAILGIFGGEAIQGFAFALCFGVIIGTYSSVYISAPVLTLFKLSHESFDGKQEAKKQLA